MTNQGINLLDIGCGSTKAEGSIGVDIKHAFGVDIIANAANLPLADNSTLNIQLRHVLEHTNDLAVLLEAKRVLKQNGAIRIEVPNAYYLPILIRYVREGVYTVASDHIHAYGHVELRQLIKQAGLEVVGVDFQPYAERHQPRKSFLEHVFPKRLRGQIIMKCRKRL